MPPDDCRALIYSPIKTQCNILTVFQQVMDFFIKNNFKNIFFYNESTYLCGRYRQTD